MHSGFHLVCFHPAEKLQLEPVCRKEHQVYKESERSWATGRVLQCPIIRWMCFANEGFGVQGIGLDDLRALFSFKTLKITIKQTPSAHLEVSKLDRGVEPSHKPL